MSKNDGILRYITKSRFVRSIFVRILLIFIIVSIAIVAVAFYSFASEISSNLILNRQQQLEVVEKTMSERMDEVNGIAYSIGNDSSFYLEPVEDSRYSGYEMSAALSRYKEGNRFIEHLAYYRLAEPDTLYISGGERSFHEFWSSSLGLDKEEADQIIYGISHCTETGMRPISLGGSDVIYLSYLYPLPQLSANPQAYVLMLISADEVRPLLQSVLTDSNGTAAIFDADGQLLFSVCTLSEPMALESYIGGEAMEEISVNGTKYVLQKQVSSTNNWTYITAVEQNSMISGLANKQIIFIVMLLVLMFVAVFVILVGIIVQYKPISNLAEEVAHSPKGEIIDERTLLTSTIATLKDDSAQKQKFETAYHEAEAANKAKSTFLSNMSHDIRTPMNAVMGMTALAYKHADEPEYVKDCLDKVQVASKYLLEIINNVLDMSRIESGKVTLAGELVDLEKLVGNLTTILSQSVEAKNQKLLVEIGELWDKTVVGDNTKLQQVFVNILSNSVKFTSEGGRISLRLNQTGKSDDGWGDYVFICSDTGIGMSEEFVGHVFDAFSRDESSARSEGTGLGMTISKNLVELMGGTIICESELGKGTTFTVTLHMLTAEEQPSAPQSNAEENTGTNETVWLQKVRVLLAEDNAMNRQIACAVIGETGAEIVAVVNGREAVQAFQANPPGYFDIILMDVQMPEMDGFAATAAIRATDRADAGTVPIIAMTASTFEEDIRKSREAGMNGHIGKPYMPETLYEVMKQALK